MTELRTAVFPVAGLGTRFLPATKANPKEMLPVVDKPLIQYAAEEAVSAGIETLVFVYGRNKGSIVDHFDKAYELETELHNKGKQEMLAAVKNVLPSHVSCVFIRQAEALGLGHAVLCARPVIGNEPFAVLLADDLVLSEQSCLSQMADVYNYHHCSVLGIENVAEDQVSSYGVIGGTSLKSGLWELDQIVEKPPIDQAPSTKAVIGRYILSHEIFAHLANQGKGAGGEIQLTDAIAKMMKSKRVLGYEFEGRRFDCGSKLGYLQAQLAYGLQHPDLGADFAEIARDELSKLSTQ
ncbi:MAG: UTP--glucose-1-phosphate uridylyltransferase GalU [Gammaproteobacteria bacterium]|nr:UTP--glucose-1-phosphate uridylyltransferase GalU [Gammaproteobacteria bacterium]